MNVESYIVPAPNIRGGVFAYPRQYREELGKMIIELSLSADEDEYLPIQYMENFADECAMIDAGDMIQEQLGHLRQIDFMGLDERIKKALLMEIEGIAIVEVDFLSDHLMYIKVHY